MSQGPRSQNGALTISVEQNRAKALTLKSQGFTYLEIGEKLGLSKTRAFELVDEALEELAEENRGRTERLRTLLLNELHKIGRPHWKNRHKPEHAAVLIRIAARKAALLGLDAPKKIEQSGPNGGPIRLEGGRVQLTDDERRRRLQEIGLTGILPAFVAGNGNGAHRDN